MSGDWNFEDFLRQLRAVKKVGPLSRLMAGIPEMGSLLSRVDVSEFEIAPIERMIEAMTPDERTNPPLLEEGDEAAVRRSRIARDSDVTSDEVTALVHQFRAMKRMIVELRFNLLFDDPPSDNDLG